MKAKIETRSKICILFIFCSLIILCIKIVPSLLVNSSEQKAIIEFYNNQYDNNDYNVIEETNLLDKSSTDTKNSRYDYIATIKIPAINLERGLVSIDNTYNNLKLDSLLSAKKALINNNYFIYDKNFLNLLKQYPVTFVDVKNNIFTNKSICLVDCNINSSCCLILL